MKRSKRRTGSSRTAHRTGFARIDEDTVITVDHSRGIPFGLVGLQLAAGDEFAVLTLL
jgi:hypothetical protein